MIEALDIWLPAWRRRHLGHEHILGVRHVMIAVCDHFSPLHDDPPSAAMRRVETWQREWPRLTQDLRDADGVEPQHTFFYPLGQYHSGVVAGLATLPGAETEVLLNHEDDTAENLRRTLEQTKEQLAGHGLLARDESGALRFGCIHGHGALDNSHPQGRHCGVCNELTVLQQSGCYADFTLPSVPERTQTRTINQLYYARGSASPKSHDGGHRVRAEREPRPGREGELLIVQGPLALDWQRKNFGFLPRVETGALTATQPPTIERMRLWLECRISVESRPNWLFIKLHTRSAEAENAGMLLGEPMRAFYRSLAEWSARDERIRFHYVSARELVNILHAAESGHSGEPGQFRNYRYRRANADQTPVSAADPGRESRAA